MNLFDKILDLIALPIRKLWRIAAHRTPQEQFRVIFTIAVLMVIVSYFTVSGTFIVYGFDEPTYFRAADTIWKGELDFYRTPVYPVICKICLILSQDKGLWIVVALQTIVFLASVVAIHKTCCLLAPHRPLVRFIAEACYSCNSTVCLWVFNILTESLSISCVVLLCFLLISILKGVHMLRNAIFLGLLFFFMVFLKPYFICFAPAVLIVIMMTSRKANTCARIVFAIGIMLNVGIYLVYCHQYEKKYGILAITSISTQNFYWQIRGLRSNHSGYKIQSDSTLRGFWLKKEDLLYAKQITSNTIKAEPRKYIISMICEFFNSGSDRLPFHYLSSNTFKATTFHPLLTLRVWEWMIFAFLLRHLWRWRKKKANVQVHTVFAIMAISGIFTVIAASEFFEYSRLLMPVYPILCLMIAAPGNFREEE